MSPDLSDEPAPPPPRTKRGRLYALAILVMVVGVGALVLEFTGMLGGDAGVQEIRRVVFPTKRSTAPVVNLGVEYHYDRNALLDSRMVDGKIVALSAAGNLVVFNSETYGLGGEKVLRRRATCLGPTEPGQVLVGIANGCIVRAATADLGFERVADVPGVPRWIGKRAKDGGLLVAYQPDRAVASVRLFDFARSRTYEILGQPAFFLDRKDRLWIATGDRAELLDLDSGARTVLDMKGGWPGVSGFTELGDGQVWAFGGREETGQITSFIARVLPGLKPTYLYQASGKRAQPTAPISPIRYVVEDAAAAQVIVVTHNSVFVSDLGFGEWKPLDAIGAGRREEGALLARGQIHRVGHGVLLTLVRGGFMEVTSEYTRRHVLDGQFGVIRPSEIVRLEKGMAIFGDGSPSFYVGGSWGALPDPVMPPADLMGMPRAGETARIWTAMLTIPLEGESSYVVVKAGAPRRYLGHIHGLRDTFLTARWDGKVLKVLGREDLPIEPVDTFVTPDQRLWNVDDQGLWSFAEGRWRLVMRQTGGHGSGVHASGQNLSAGREQTGFRTAIGEPLHFAQSSAPPFYGLPSAASSWALVKLDKNDEGGIPLIDEVPVVAEGRRVLVHDLVTWDKKDELLLAINHGLCLFNVKYATCEVHRPEGLTDEVNLIRRDHDRRVWLGGRGLWVLRDLGHARALQGSLPTLADTRVVAMAEAPDGRLVLGLEDRGVIFLTLPAGWLEQPPRMPSTLPPWEETAPHEPQPGDASLIVRECPGAKLTDATYQALVKELRGFAETGGGRMGLTSEITFEGRPDIVVRGPEVDQLQAGVLPIVEKASSKGRFSVWKREGGAGSETIQVRYCQPR